MNQDVCINNNLLFLFVFPGIFVLCLGLICCSWLRRIPSAAFSLKAAVPKLQRQRPWQCGQLKRSVALKATVVGKYLVSGKVLLTSKWLFGSVICFYIFWIYIFNDNFLLLVKHSSLLYFVSSKWNVQNPMQTIYLFSLLLKLYSNTKILQGTG